MAIRIEWDEFEIALLIEACEEVLRKGKPKSEVVKTVSSNLRKRAISKNIAIDDVFRNENGIALQMQKMAYLLTHGEKGMPGASKLYAEVAELREENPKKFEEILKRAKEEIEMTDLSQQNIDKKALFAQWLNEHPIKKYTPSAIIDALDVASRYCVSKKVCKDGFWSMQNKAEFNAATSKLLSFRLFRLKYRSAAAKMDKAIPLYKAFLDSYVASREENTAEFEGEALNEPDSMLSTAAANSDDIIRLDFSDIGSLIFSKPVCLNYKDHTFTDFNSWASLYAKVAFLLKQDYPQIIVDGGSLSEGAAPEFSMNSKALRKPKAITDGLFIETNHSATEIASRIATLLRLCGVDLNKVSITYTLKKEAEQKRTSQARSENEKLYEKLYSISRIYDDPAGLSLNRITGLLGQSDDRELVQGILDHAPWAHRIENGIYSFASADTISARNEKKAGKDDTISDSAFYDYLVFIEFTADPDKYYFFKDYMSVEANVKIDDTAEVEDFLLSAGKPMKVEDVCTALTHIPKERVDSIIKFDSRFRRNAKGEYFHADIFEISEPELEKIAAIIDGSIAENGYAIWTDIWNIIQETMPVFLENNLYLSALGVRNAISAHYLGKFNFNGAVISRPENHYEMRDIYQLYAKHHPTFTADDIYNLSKELDTVIYFEALSEVSVRVSHDLFISKEMIPFDTDAVDRAINSFLSKDYIRIREIDSFLIFPNVGYEWNEYLLESFLLSYSKKFALVNNGLSLNNVAGFVVKKSGQINDFIDACAAFLADGRIELKKVDALNYLADMNVISRRGYKDIDLALRRAAQIRRRKE